MSRAAPAPDGARGPDGAPPAGGAPGADPAPGAAPAFDPHVHAHDPRLPGSKPFPAWFGDPARVAAELARGLAAAGADGALAMGSLEVSERDPLGLAGARAVRDALAALPPSGGGAGEGPSLGLIGTADPRRADDRAHLARVERELARPEVRGLKAYLGYLPFAADHRAWRPYYELAGAAGKPVVLHTGDTYATGARVRYAHPLPVDDAAVDHPGTRFVIAHLGCPWFLDAAEVVYKNDNVWADLSGWLVGDEVRDERARAFFRARAGEALAYAGRWDRILFGSDWPLAPIATYRAFVEALAPEERRAALLGGNARALFGA